VVRLDDIPSPDAGVGEVVVALEAAPLHIADLMAIRGELPFIPPGGGAPGFEGVGRVVRRGPGVKEWAPGDRVILPLAYGACCEEAAVKAEHLWRAPEHVAAEQLALVRINLTTAYLLLHAFETLRPGDVIVQNAANSNVAGYVAMLARSRGLELIDIVRRPELVDRLARSGRAALLDGPDLAKAVAARVSRPPRLGLDAIGGEATRRLASSIGDGGQVLCYGFMAHEPYCIDIADAMFRDVRLRGMTIRSAMLRLDSDALAAMSRTLQDLIATAPLEAEIAGIYSFDQVGDALRHASETGAKRAGKVILKPKC
jgi:NADPH:quinone reductase-like Zn-dependent oxidoreductase